MSLNGRVQCVRCHAQMEAGYVPDATEYGWAEQIWHPGKPQRNWRQRDEERSMCSSHDAPLSEVRILRILCGASKPF